MHLFVITSVVNSKLPSPVSPLKRYEQLHETIDSVHKYMKDMKYCIVVLEGSLLSQTQIDQLSQKIDYFYHVNNVLGLPKSIGEYLLLMTYFSSDQFKKIKHDIETISKLSGRYYLTESFNFSKYDVHSSIIKYDVRSWYRADAGIYDTRYYRFHVDYIDYFVDKLKKVLESILNHQDPDIEHAFFSNQILPPHTLIHPENLGVEGLISISSDIVKD